MRPELLFLGSGLVPASLFYVTSDHVGATLRAIKLSVLSCPYFESQQALHSNRVSTWFLPASRVHGHAGDPPGSTHRHGGLLAAIAPHLYQIAQKVSVTGCSALPRTGTIRFPDGLMATLMWMS